MKKTIIIGLSLALAFALVGAALAWGPGFGPRFGRAFGGPANVPPIPNLTAEQSAQIQALRDGFLKENESLQKELYAKGSELRNLWRSQNPDQAVIAAKRTEIAGLQSQLADKAANLRNCHISVRSIQLFNAFYNLIRNMRDDLHRLSQILAVPFLHKNGVVN